MDGRNVARYAPLLRAGRWFHGLPAALQDALLAAAVLREITPGQRLFSRGDPPSGIYAVLEGGIRITAVAPSGKEALLTLAEPPSWFGEIAMFDGDARTHDAVADAASVVAHVPQPALEAILASEPTYWRDLGRLVASKLRLMFMVMEDAAVLPLPVRLARRLLLMAEGEWKDRKRRVVEARQEQLALMLSTSRQTANQALKDLEAKGLVRLSYGQVEILDFDGLRRVAQMSG